MRVFNTALTRAVVWLVGERAHGRLCMGLGGGAHVRKGGIIGIDGFERGEDGRNRNGIFFNALCKPTCTSLQRKNPR